MLFLQFISLILMLIFFILSLFEYAMLRKMVEIYYRNGPFPIKKIIRSSLSTKDMLVEMIKRKSGKELCFRVIEDGIMLYERPSMLLFFSRGILPTQRVFINLCQDFSKGEFYCEIRPFYSAFLFPAFFAFSLILNFILQNQYTNVSMKAFEFVVVLFMALGLFFPFRPRPNYINQLQNFLKINSMAG